MWFWTNLSRTIQIAGLSLLAYGLGSLFHAIIVDDRLGRGLLILYLVAGELVLTCLLFVVGVIIKFKYNPIPDSTFFRNAYWLVSTMLLSFLCAILGYLVGR